jgi:hypothetical protein
MAIKRPKASRLRRALLVTLAAIGMGAVGAPSCGGAGGGPSSQVSALRVIAVTTDKPYAAPDEKVTLKLTFADALDVNGGGPRPVEVWWIGDCYNPIADAFEACFPQMQDTLAGLFLGVGGTEGRGERQELGPELSGVPEASMFELDLSQKTDMFGDARLAENGTPYTTAYVFFIVCAGNLAPVEITPEEQLGFPLACLDGEGNAQSADSFVVGYTQLYIFADGRANASPPVLGLTLDGADIADGEENAPTVPRCVAAAETEENAGCGAPPEPTDCKEHKIEALVEDVAEVDIESAQPGMAPVRESVWVDYFADGGSLQGAKKLVNDTTAGYYEDHATTWTAPAEAGLISIWAVAHDGRGGSSVTRRFIRVE